MMAHGRGSSLKLGFLSSEGSCAMAGIRVRLGEFGNALDRRIWISFFASIILCLKYAIKMGISRAEKGLAHAQLWVVTAWVLSLRYSLFRPWM